MNEDIYYNTSIDFIPGIDFDPLDEDEVDAVFIASENDFYNHNRGYY